jgi:hypothetical protein
VKKIPIFILAPIGGMIITLLTGLIDTTPQGLVGASHYGYPWAWRHIPVVLNPVTNYDAVNFTADYFFWGIIVAIPLFLWWKMKK